MFHKRPQRTRAFDNPEALWNAACDYFDEAHSNPILKEVMTKDGPASLAMPRAFTMQGFCSYLGFSHNGLRRYIDRPEFDEVLGRIDDIMFAQKFENAAAGTMNSNLIIRDLKLADKQELDANYSGEITTIERRFITKDE